MQKHSFFFFFSSFIYIFVFTYIFIYRENCLELGIEGSGSKALVQILGLFGLGRVREALLAPAGRWVCEALLAPRENPV